MPLNFPSNPSTGTQYASTSGITYVYDGRKWIGKAQTLLPGTNAITNVGYVVQVTNTGSLMIPVGATIIDENYDPVLAPRGYTGSQGGLELNGQPIVTLNTATGVFTKSGTTATINNFYGIDSIHFSDGTIQTRAARTNQDLYTSSNVTFVAVTATSINFADGTIQTTAARTNQALYTTSTVTFNAVNANKFIAAHGPAGSTTTGYSFSSDLTSGIYSPTNGVVDVALLGNTVTSLTTTSFKVYLDLLPSQDNTYDLGSNSLRWKDSHIANKVYVDKGIYAANGLEIQTNSGAYTWTFTATQLTLPGGSRIFTGDGGIPGNFDIAAGPGGWAEIGSNNGATYVWVEDNYAYIATAWTGTSRTWAFDTSGGMTFPDGTTQTTAFVLTTLSNVTYADITSTGALSVNQTKETYTALSGATGVVTHNCGLGQIFYHTNVANTFTVNLTNLTLATGFATNITLVINQGATAYVADSLQVNGTPQTILWQGSLTAPQGNIFKTDLMSFSLISTGTNDYLVLGQLVSYG